MRATMDWFRYIENFFNNQSVGAFIGAFSAFALVVLNDRLRDARKVKNISSEIEMNLAHAKGKLDSVRSNRTLMKEQNRVMAAPILKFNIMLIRQLAAEVLSQLSLDQRRAIEALCYRMEATAEILDEAYLLTKKFSEPLGKSDHINTSKRLLANYSDAIVNLKLLAEMCENYVTGNYAVIVTKQYTRLEYEEK